MNAAAQPAYQGPPGATVFAKAQQLEAAGNKAAAAVAYQQAYEAYMSVDDSDGMTKALARKNALGGAAPGLAVRPAAAAPRPAAPGPAPVAARPAPAAAPAPVVAPLPGRTTGGKPVGLFFFMDVFNNERIYYFTPAGQVYMDPANFSPAGLAAVDPRWRGTYAVNGSQMTVRWAAGPPSTFDYRSDPTGFSWNGGFICVGPFSSARQLLSTFEGRNAAVSVTASSLAVYRTLSFKADGTFTRDNLTDGHLEANTGSVTNVSSASKQAGRWSLNGWFLTLTDGQGTIRNLAFPTSLDEKTGKAFYFRFNGTTYKTTAR
ncbi:hypothetical protein GCM10028824_10450 [Hymenobacter segetis]|uniref:Uncharacterized protein n=1 Tax=Hymenobacter segetis TaxID=2025509 RepID=A0ABU9M163_9BACT